MKAWHKVVPHRCGMWIGWKTGIQRTRTCRCLLILALLAVLVGRIVSTYRIFNDTSDESVHIRAGLEIWQRGRYTIETLHPPLARLVLATLPYHVAGLRLNERDELWRGGAWDQQDGAYFWKTLALARAGNLIFAVLLFFFVYRWSAVLYGPQAALMACLLVICCPNLIAHASLATSDLGSTATILMAAYFLWRWSQEPGLRYCLASAAACSAAVLCKFSALFFLPPLGLLYFLVARWRRWRQGGLFRFAIVWTSVQRVPGFCLFFLFVVWAGYLFEIGTIVPPGHRYIGPSPLGPDAILPNFLLKTVGDKRLPAHRFALGVIDVLTFNASGHRAYLLGHFSQHGWWYYFPMAVAVKSTLPLLLLVGIGVGLYAARRYAGSAVGTSYPLLGVGVVLAMSMFAKVNLGIRYVLPIFPFFAILASGVLADRKRLPTRRRAFRVAALCLVAWHAGESVAAHPDYLAYFNQIARGKEERFLLDSNLDWGQDLARLGRFVQKHQIRLLHLSYFGLASPAKMGVVAKPLSPHHHPQAGWSAISVNNLFGLVDDPAEFQWLRERQPIARVGKSIWVYYLPGVE